MLSIAYDRQPLSFCLIKGEGLRGLLQNKGGYKFNCTRLKKRKCWVFPKKEE